MRSTRTSKMAPCSELLSYLRILTSNPGNTPSTDRKKEFDDVLVSNIERLSCVLREKGRFAQLQERLDVQVKKRSETLGESREACKGTFSEKDSKKEDSGPGKAVLEQQKDSVRWTYVKTCLELLKLLKESLIELKNESEGRKPEPKLGKRGNEAPPLPADSLSVGDQKTVLTAIQFVVILGICPNLLKGVGLPVEKRSGFASLINIQYNTKNERRLFECIDTLVECIAQPSLGSLVLSRHLGDILSGLLQICYAPVSAYSDFNTNASSCTYVNKDSVARTSCTLDNLPSDNSVIVCNGSGGIRNLSSEAKNSDKDGSFVEIHPSDVYNLACESSCSEGENHSGLFISSSEREKCVCNLQRILDRVYQPIVIRELLLLQGSTASTGKESNKDNLGKTSVAGEKRVGAQGLKHSVLPSQTPKWLRNVCGQLLSERLMKPNGVKAVLYGILDISTGT